MKKYQNKKWLIEQYEKGKTVKQVAKECGISDRTLSVHNRKLEIDPKYHYSKFHHPYKNIDWLKEQVERYGSGLSVANETGYPVTSINRYITKFGLIERKYKTKLRANLDVDYFEKIDTEEKAYWLGFIMADGNMHERENPVGNRYTFSIKIKSTDINHLEKFKEAIDFDGNIKTVKGRRNETNTIGVQIRVYNEKFCLDLISHGIIPRKGGTEHIPETVPDNLVRHYIRGYFDGDGSITKQKIISICASDELERQLFEIFDDKKIEYKTYQIGRIKNPRIHKKDSVYKFLRYIYKDSTIYLDRKYYRSMQAILQYESAI